MSEKPDAAVSVRQTQYALFLLFAINLLNFYDRQILGAVTEPIRRDWHLSDSALGWLGTAFTLFYAAVGLPLGRWADRGSRPRILSFGVAVWSVFTAASGMAWNYWSLFVARIGVGFGEASCAPAGNALIGDLFPPARRARATSVFMLGLPIGIFLANLLSGLIAKSYGWRAAFFVATVPGLILAILALRIVEPGRGASAQRAANSSASRAHNEGQSWVEPYLELWRIPTLRWIVLSGALANFNAYAVNAFMPAFLMRYHRMSLSEASVAAAFTLGAVGVVSLLLGGVAADWARKKRMDGRLLLGSLSLLLSTPCILLALMQPAGAVVPFVALMGTGWMLFYVYYVTVYPALQDVVSAHLRATAMSVYFFWMYVLGGAFGTSILGMLSDRFAKRAMRAGNGTEITEVFRAIGLHDAFFVVPAISMTLALVLLAASRTVAQDITRAEGRP